MTTSPAFPVPRVEGLPVLGSALRAFGQRKVDFLVEMARRYPDVCVFRALGRDSYLVNSPELACELLVHRFAEMEKAPILRTHFRPFLGDNLITLEGDAHRKRRRHVLPGFQAKDLLPATPVFVEETEKALARWLTSGVLDIERELTGLTLRITARALFGSHLDGAEMRIAEAVLAANRATLWEIPNPLPRGFWTPARARIRAAARTVDTLVHGMIAQRRDAGRTSHGNGGRDLLRRGAPHHPQAARGGGCALHGALNAAPGPGRSRVRASAGTPAES